MKKFYLILALLFLAWSCGEKKHDPQFTFKGNAGAADATLYLFGLDSHYDAIDSTLCDENGNFEFTIPLNTTASLALVTPDGQVIPVYAEPDCNATLSKDSSYRCGWRVDAGNTQALYNSITLALDKCTEQEDIIALVDSFITAQPASEVNIEVLRRYIVDIPEPANKEIRDKINKFSGKLQDHEYPTRIKKLTENNSSNILHRSFPSFSYTTADSVNVALSTYLRKYTLVTFWASWDKESRERMKLLRNIQDSVSSKSFAILNISLDYDRAEWLQAITEDSIAGANVNDAKTMSSDLFNSFNIKKLPFSLLVSPYQRVMEYDVDLSSAASRIDSLANRYDKEQERKKKKEEEDKKKNK